MDSEVFRKIEDKFHHIEFDNEAGALELKLAYRNIGCKMLGIIKKQEREIKKLKCMHGALLHERELLRWKAMNET